MLKEIEKNKDKIKEEEWNPFVIFRSQKFFDNGQIVTRLQIFLDILREFIKTEFDFDELKQYFEDPTTQESIYLGLNRCHKGHIGISAAKLYHVVVCLRDYYEGPGNWKWSDQPDTGPPS